LCSKKKHCRKYCSIHFILETVRNYNYASTCTSARTRELSKDSKLSHAKCDDTTFAIFTDSVQHRKWPTNWIANNPMVTNNPQIGPQMILLKRKVEWLGQNLAWQLTLVCVETTKHHTLLRTTQILRGRVQRTFPPSRLVTKALSGTPEVLDGWQKCMMKRKQDNCFLYYILICQ